MRRIGAGLVLLALAGCRGGEKSDVVPWLPAAPPQADPIVVSLAPPCDADQLRGRLRVQGAGGTLVGGIAVRNTGEDACSLTGRASARLVGGTAPETRWRVLAMKAQPWNTGPIVASLASVRAIEPGHQAWVALFWSNWCPAGTRLTTSGEPPKALLLGLPADRELRFPIRGFVSRCDAPRSASRLGIAPFRPLGREPARSTRIPLRASFNGVARPEVKFGTPELRAPRGGVLRYRIALTSRLKTPFAFSACPVYEQRAFTHLREAYVLSCRAAGAFAPGERKVFAMELKVPADAPLGRQPLVWVLGPDTYVIRGCRPRS